MDARDRVLLWIILIGGVCVFLMVIYSLLVAASKEDRRMEIREDRVMTPTYTPVPAPEQWVRYHVPLDDDLQRYIEKLCKEKEVPSSVVIAVISVETDGEFDIRDPYQTAREIIDRLSEKITTYDGDWDKALSTYNHDSTGRYAERVQAYAECLAESVMPFSE